MKHEALFSYKYKSKNIKVSSAAIFIFGALMVKDISESKNGHLSVSRIPISQSTLLYPRIMFRNTGTRNVTLRCQ